MIWVQIVLLVIKLLLELPSVKEWLERIFGALSQARPLQAAREASKVKIALATKYEQFKTGQMQTACPLEALAFKLEEKYGQRQDAN